MGDSGDRISAATRVGRDALVHYLKDHPKISFEKEFFLLIIKMYYASQPSHCLLQNMLQLQDVVFNRIF